MKKLMYVITKSNFGGAGHYIYDLATSSKEAGFDVLVVCGGSGLLVEKLKGAGIRTISIDGLERDINVSKEFNALSSLREVFRSEKPDVVHLNSSKIGGIGALAGRLEKVPRIIFTAHGWAFNEDRSFSWRFLAYWASVATAILSHTIITISYKEQKQAVNFPFVGADKVRMIYIGANGANFLDKERAREYIRHTTGVHLQNNVPIFGTIGELHKNKGYIYALTMCENLKKAGHSFFYLIIGEGEDRKDIEAQIKIKKLENNVALLGAIPDSASSATLLKAFDIFLLPSVKEGLPYVLIEAGHAKVMAIATRVGGVPELIIDEESGLIAEPKDASSLTNEIEKVLFDVNARNDFANNLHERVSYTFSLESMVEETLLEYK